MGGGRPAAAPRRGGSGGPRPSGRVIGSPARAATARAPSQPSPSPAARYANAAAASASRPPRHRSDPPGAAASVRDQPFLPSPLASPVAASAGLISSIVIFLPNETYTPASLFFL